MNITYDEREVKSFPVHVAKEMHQLKGLDVRREVWELMHETDEGVLTETEFLGRFGKARPDYGGTDYRPVPAESWRPDRWPAPAMVYRFETGGL